MKKGTVYEGNPEEGVKPDTTLSVTDTDLVDIALGKLNPQVESYRIKKEMLVRYPFHLCSEMDAKLVFIIVKLLYSSTTGCIHERQTKNHREHYVNTETGAITENRIETVNQASQNFCTNSCEFGME